MEYLTVGEVEQNLRFQGQYLDNETELRYNKFGYYDPKVGRYISCPIMQQCGQGK
ncbi:TPA: hypothetical protein QEM50_005180 [Pseudomonas putida]|nr:RHS repeat-associated core domain-containing protein [Pseudomonas putida]HDS1769750.1 hypothetical protein [Pseudomonas putida]